MVYLFIQNSLVLINTLEVNQTNNGYLSKTYSSQYLDPKTQIPIGPEGYFSDDF